MFDKVSKVSIVKCPSYNQKKIDEAVRLAINKIGFKAKNNSTVLIKPNIVGSYKAKEGATTNPAVIKAIIKVLKEKNCKITIGESSYTDTRGALKKAGVTKLEKISGVEVLRFELAGKIHLKNRNAKYLKDIHIPKIIKEADLVINVPKFKTHVLTKYTGAVKNLFGCIPGEEKRVYHRKADSEAEFSELLIELYSGIKPQLNILDGVISMEGQGPTGGKLKKTKLILASNNSIALDIVAARIMGFEEDDVLTNRIGKEKKLVGKIEVDGKIENLNFEKAIPIRKYFFLNKMIPLSQIKLKEKKCKKCYLCVKNCPVKAMKINERKYPEVDVEKCIRCFCCIESCPQHALYIGVGSRKHKKIMKRILRNGKAKQTT